MSDGIRCPECGLSTSVLETRSIEGGYRRRRACGSTACTWRTTTIELLAPAAMVTFDGRLALVPIGDIRTVRDMLNRLSLEDETTAQIPEGAP